MGYTELYEKIRDMAFNTRRGIENTVNPRSFVEQAKNILYNNMDDIEAALKFASEASKKIAVLELELDDAERELDQLTKKTAPRKKGKGANE